MKITISPHIIALAVACLALACGDPEAAKVEARKYCQDLGYEVQGISCASIDSDDDGYLSCSVRVKGQDLPLALECSRGTWTFTGGCKQAQVMKVRQRAVSP